jgi:predicted secreted protein with PEFG-CTERM motif
VNNKNLVIPVAITLALIVISPYLLHPAEAHVLKTFQNISVKIGLLNEPPLVGDLNEIDVYLYNGTDDSAPPIADTGLDNMKITLQYGGQTKALSFDPSDDTPGLYTAAFTPTQLGTYNVIIQGTIGGVTIPPTTYPQQEVESKDKYYFPPMTGSMVGMSGNMTGMSGNQTVPEFGPIVSLVLVIAIISAVVVTGRARGFLKF